MRVDGHVQGQALNVANLTDILSRLNPGDIVRAQILDIMGKEVLLKLFDGTQLKAALMADIDVGKGDFANFLVKSKSENQVILEQIINVAIKNESLESILIKQLDSSGIQPNAKNMEIAEKLIKNSLPFKKDLFDNVIAIMEKFKDLGTSKSVFLASNNLNPNEKNIDALKYLVDAKMQIGNEIEHIMDALTSSKDNYLLKENNKDAIKINQKSTDAEILQFIEDELQAVDKTYSSNIVKKLNLESKLKDFLLNSMELSTDEADNMISQIIKDIPSIFSPKERILIFDFLKDLAIKFKLLDNKGIDQSNAVNKMKFEDLKDEFKKLFIKIDTKNLDKELNIKDVYKELYEKLETLKGNSGLSVLTGKDELLQRTENLQNHIRFINNINSHNSYIQIPINIFNKNSTGELYILKRESRKKKINPDNVTMLVALDTQFIGRFETLITVNKNNIALNIRVEDQKVISHLKENYKDLYSRINGKGYKLVDVKYRLIDEPINVINANEVATRELSFGKISVDIKL